MMENLKSVEIDDASRLETIARAHLHGHLGDTDLDAVVSTLAIACRVPIAVVNIVTPGLQTYAAEVGVHAPFTTIEDRLSFCARVVETGKALTVIDATLHRTYRENPMVSSGQLRAYAGEPLVVSNIVLGSVAMFDTVPRTFSQEELSVLRLQAKLSSAVLALREAAQMDYLTGLPNRALLMDRLGHALDRSQRSGPTVRIAVLFVDVDEFKAINDGRGHAAGDQRLIEVAERLRRAVRPGDTVARLGGDEFVVVCEDLESDSEAIDIAQRLALTVGEGSLAFSEEFPLAVSIGVALAEPGANDSAALLAVADAAMYRAKQRVGSSWELAGESQRLGSLN